MFFELIATFVAGIAGAGVAMLARKLTGGRLARWIVPVAAGATMLGVTIANEYSWYDRTSAVLPNGIEVALSVEETVFYRPWTYLRPFVTRFVAVDLASMRTNDAFPDQRIVNVILYGRWTQTKTFGVIFDCEKGRRADMVESVDFADDGAVEGVVWLETGFDDPVVKTACGRK
ncbi:MAG: hypothetical protein AAF638_07230 [Pseudomonadota bacterium]